MTPLAAMINMLRNGGMSTANGSGILSGMTTNNSPVGNLMNGLTTGNYGNSPVGNMINTIQSGYNAATNPDLYQSGKFMSGY